MALLTQIKNGAIEGSGTTLANADVDKSVSGDTLIVFDASATAFKRVSASGLVVVSFLEKHLVVLEILFVSMKTN